MSVTRQITAMPISTGLPRQSLIFCRELFRVIILREIFLPMPSLWETAFAPPSTSPLWLSLVPAAGLTAVQKGQTQ